MADVQYNSGPTLGEATPNYIGKLPIDTFVTGSSISVSANVSWDVTSYGIDVTGVYLAAYLKNVVGETTYHWGTAVLISYPTTQKSGTVTLSGVGSFDRFGLSDGQYHIEYDLYVVGKNNFAWFASGVDHVFFDWFNYSGPSISAFSVLRCNSDGTTNESGTRAKISATYAVTPIGDNNTKALAIKYREAGATTWTQETIDISELDYSDSVPETVLAATFAADKTYEVRAELTDLLNTTTHDKTLAPAFALVHYHADKAHVAFGKYAESDGPGFDVALDARFRDAVQFDVAPTIPDVAERAALLAHLTPYCKLSNPVSETVTRNASYYFWAFDFRNSANPGEYTILEGGASGTRKMGWEIPTDGIYRVTMTAKFKSGSTASAIVIGIARMTSDWSPPAANYMTEAALAADEEKLELLEQHVPSWGAAITNGQYVGDLVCTAEEKIWPTAFLVTASKAIDVDNTWCSIQRIG